MKFLPQILLTAAVIAVASGAIALVMRSSDSEGIQITFSTPSAEQGGQLGVYITGAVQFPGVYGLAEGDRLQQALQAAGGPTADADLTAVNLAIRLSDEDHWHIPVVGESLSGSIPAAANQTSAPSPPFAGYPKPIDVNSADAESLEALPGIGQVRANAIVAYRDANGPYPTVDDLLAVNGIGPATLESIRNLIDAR